MKKKGDIIKQTTIYQGCKILRIFKFQKNAKMEHHFGTFSESFAEKNEIAAALGQIGAAGLVKSDATLQRIAC